MSTLAELKAAKSAREEERKAKRAAIELQSFELVEKYEKEIGAEGVDFALVDLSDLLESPIVVKRGPSVTYKTFINSQITAEDVDQFVASSLVFPDVETFLTVAKKFGAVPNRCATALTKLHGFKVEQDAKKA